MTRLMIATVLSLSIFGSAAVAQRSTEPPLTNTSIVKLVKAGLREKTVIVIIDKRRSVFNLDPEQLIQLKRQGVSENVILELLGCVAATCAVNDDEEWASDEQFFRGLKKPGNGGDRSGSGGIFGSGGSSQSQSRSNMGGDGSQNEGNVTGSATVRIVRPTAEAGGTATTKLEK